MCYSSLCSERVQVTQFSQNVLNIVFWWVSGYSAFCFEIILGTKKIASLAKICQGTRHRSLCQGNYLLNHAVRYALFPYSESHYFFNAMITVFSSKIAVKLEQIGFKTSLIFTEIYLCHLSGFRMFYLRFGTK